MTRYDGFGRDSASFAEGLLRGRVTYDVLNRPRELFEGTQVTPIVMSYDSLFRTQVQDRKGQVYRYEHNALGWLTREYDPVNASMTYRHDRSGLATSWTNRRGQIVDYRYDAAGRIVSKRGVNAATDSFAYSPDDRKVMASSAVSIDSVYLNTYGQPDSAVTWLAGKRYRRQYRWNGNGALDSVGVSTTSAIVFAQTRYVQPTGLLDTLRINGQAIRYSYNKEFQRTSTAFPAGSPNVTRSEFYTSLHQRYRTTFNNGGINNALWRNYSFDERGRIEQEDRIGGGDTKVRTFGYDDRGQLSRAEQSTVAFSLGCSEPTGTEIVNDGTECVPMSQRTVTANYGFLYDSAGNLRQQTDSVSGATTTGSHSTGNLIGQWGSTTYGHDLDGNRTSKVSGGVTTIYGWSADGRLTTVTSGGTTLGYDYNALGQPVRRTRNGATDRYFLWDGNQLKAELTASSTRIAEYVYQGGIDNPVALVTGSTVIAATRYLQEDELGNVSGVFGSAVAQTLTYDARGRLDQITGTLADTNRVRWKGLVWEGDITQLYYMRNRWYDPETGRFATEDPIGLAGGPNVYAFGGNDPINARDPSGLTECIIYYEYDYDQDGYMIPGTFRITNISEGCYENGSGGGGGAGTQGTPEEAPTACNLLATVAGAIGANSKSPSDFAMALGANVAGISNAFDFWGGGQNLLTNNRGGFRPEYGGNARGQPRHFAASVWAAEMWGEYAAREIFEHNERAGRPENVQDFDLSVAAFRFLTQLDQKNLSTVQQQLTESLCRK